MKKKLLLTNFLVVLSFLIPTGSILFYLNQLGPNKIVESFPNHSNKEQKPILFKKQNDQKGKFYYLDVLASKSLIDLNRVSEISFKLATYLKSPYFVDSQLKINGENCTFSGPKSIYFSDNQFISFKKEKNCSINNTQNYFHLRIKIYSTSQSTLAMWAFKKEDQNLTSYRFNDSKYSNTIPQIKIYSNTNYQDMTRWSLLKTTWDKSRGSYTLEIIGLISLLLYLLFVLIFIPSLVAQNKISSTYLATGFTSLFCSIGLLFAIIFPPFHSPDEPDHFISYLEQAGINNPEEESLKIASLGHFSEIRQLPENQFTTTMANTKGTMTWGSQGGTSIHKIDSKNRSLLTHKYWVLCSTLLSKIMNFRYSYQLFLMRILNLILVCFFFFIFLLSIAKNTNNHILFYNISLPFFSMLTLPFFATGISNYPVLIANFFMCLAILFWKTSRHYHELIRSVLFGSSLALFIHCSRVSVFIIPFMISIYSINFFKKEKFSKSLFTALSYLMSFALSFYLVIFTLGFPSKIPIHWFIRKIYPSASNYLSESPLTTLTIAIFLSSLIIYGLYSLFLSNVNKMNKYISKSNTWFPISIFFIVFISSYFYQDLSLENIQENRSYPLFEYAKNAVLLFFLSPSPLIDDFFVVKTFWIGFGWLDVMINQTVLALVKLLPFLSILILFLYSSNTKKNFYSLFIICISIAIGLFLEALANKIVHINLHGRYLINQNIAFCCIPILFKYTNLKKIHALKYLAIIQVLIIGYATTSSILSIIQRYVG